jgi:ribose/xylose/arabinose/galactoside ABC-type transport system permease subunit
VRLPLAAKNVPLATTTAVCLLLYAAACWRYPHFASWTVFVNFFGDNAFLGLAAIGMTFVILSGGIDLSVGAVIGLTSIAIAALVERAGLPPLVVLPAILALGSAFGAGMGGLIHLFRMPPFLVTLAGMFLARGAGFVISLETITIRQPLYDHIGDVRCAGFQVPALALLGAVAVAVYVARWTRFGRNVYAVGGSEPSALLMGLPIGRTKVLVYALSGLCSSAAGIVYTFYTFSGNAGAGTTLELDAIAAVVIGGTLLSGGVGHVAGTLIGVLIYGIIQTAIAFEGTLSSWWTRIAVGALLLVFILLQRLLQQGALGRTGRTAGT